MSEASAIMPKWHENPCDSTLITYHYSFYSYSLCSTKKVCDYKKCAIMEIIALVSIGVNVLLLM